MSPSPRCGGAGTLLGTFSDSDGAIPLSLHALRAGLASLALLALAACSTDDIRTYDAPKDPAVTAVPATATSPRAPETPRWTLPDGWEENPGSGMRYATIQLGPRDRPLELRVTPLGRAAGDPLANVNVWRGQIGLDPIEPSELEEHARAVTVEGEERHLIDLRGPGRGGEPPQRMLAAIVPAPEKVWFFVLVDEPQRIAAHEAEFEEFVLGVRFAGAPVAAAPPAGGAEETMTWTLPDGWAKQTEGSSSMRVATFVSSASPDLEVTITRFPGAVGGLLANVNRWRGQLGLAPVRDLADESLTDVVVAGAPGQLLDLRAEGNNPRRMRVLIAERPVMTWFVKMTGPDDQIEAEGARFQAFVDSIEFRGATSG